jgi:hypothetical protein
MSIYAPTRTQSTILRVEWLPEDERVGTWTLADSRVALNALGLAVGAANAAETLATAPPSRSSRGLDQIVFRLASFKETQVEVLRLSLASPLETVLEISKALGPTGILVALPLVIRRILRIDLDIRFDRESRLADIEEETLRRQRAIVEQMKLGELSKPKPTEAQLSIIDKDEWQPV